MIQVKDLTKRFANTLAVDGISFHVEKGEILGFLGPNGAGKTTTMRILTCFMPATAGTALVAGYDIFNDSIKVRQNVGYMPENVPLYHDMRVSEYLTFRAKLKGVPRRRRRQRIAECMEKCSITDVQRKVIGTLSKGYRQRVGLAESMLHDPKILILDEPTIGLDPNQIRQARHLIKELGRSHTILLSTHILPEVEMVCGRVIIINKGKIVAMDTPENLMNRLRGATTVSLEVRGPGQQIKECLETLDGVKKIVWHDKGEISHYTLEAAKGVDPREEIFHRIAKNNWVLREMKREAMTLEDIFVQITTQEKSA
ncbi:MAG: ATP-binding cassette domain-containing protein [Planctomycetes bacterium]|nr:ATP-binding cassette domain-containing protein [Planctomycetota bacterium]